MIIYIAYLQAVPEDLIEAAKIDGANSFQRFRHITFSTSGTCFYRQFVFDAFPLVQDL